MKARTAAQEAEQVMLTSMQSNGEKNSFAVLRQNATQDCFAALPTAASAFESSGPQVMQASLHHAFCCIVAFQLVVLLFASRAMCMTHNQFIDQALHLKLKSVLVLNITHGIVEIASV